MNANHQPDFSELQSLLRAEADAVPHRDLEDAFLGDLHQRIQQQSNTTLLTRLQERLSFSLPTLAWSGTAAATAAIAIFLGLSLGTDNTTAPTYVSASEAHGDLVFVKADERVDVSGTIPTFIEQPFEF